MRDATVVCHAATESPHRFCQAVSRIPPALAPINHGHLEETTTPQWGHAPLFVWIRKLPRPEEADALIDRLMAAVRPITSAVAIFDATPGLCRPHHVSVEEAKAGIDDLLRTARTEVVSIGLEESLPGVCPVYGTGRGHPAQRNLGECCAAAVAKRQGTMLLFKGNDFSRADISRDA